MNQALRTDLPRYDPRRTYEENFAAAPDPVDLEVRPLPGAWSFCDLAVGSPLGIPAGPLLNGRWVLYYASLGFDILTYKTVRCQARPCYPLPNLQPVVTGPLAGGEERLAVCDEMQGSWAVSFGMPSKEPAFWREDIARTRAELAAGKILVVSVVGTIQQGWTIDQLADDYAQCAAWAVESGADAVETNFSCPNVSTCDGQLYQDAAGMRVVVQRVRQAIPDVPYVLKIGHLDSAVEVDRFLDAAAGQVDAVAMTNSIATHVAGSGGELLFGGERRGICGAATLEASLRQTELFAERLVARGETTRLVGVGGAASATDVARYLSAGAEAVQMATAAMVDPAVGLRIRREWSGPA